MGERTLVTKRLYFGMDALYMRAAAARVVARVVGLPPERARVNRRHLRQDFGVDTVQCNSLVHEFVADGLLDRREELPDEYRLTRRFREFATARVVEPLPRDRARLIVGKACELATSINADWSRNPLEIATIAPFGVYMSRHSRLAELPLGLIVRPRPQARRARWGRVLTKPEGASEIRGAMRELSSFIRVRIFQDLALLPRGRRLAGSARRQRRLRLDGHRFKQILAEGLTHIKSCKSCDCLNGVCCKAMLEQHLALLKRSTNRRRS